MAVGDAEAETLMEAAERQILQIQYARSLREPPWDGRSLLHKVILCQGFCNFCDGSIRMISMTLSRDDSASSCRILRIGADM